MRDAGSRFADSTGSSRRALGDLLTGYPPGQTGYPSGKNQGRGALRGRRGGRCFHACWLAIALALAMAAALPSAASADYGVVGQFKFGSGVDAPGAFGELRSLGVNFDGSGGTSPGEIYGQDFGSGFNGGRIQQYSATGEFRRLWGLDVVSSGPDNANEVQSLMVKATAGTYTLTFGGETTDSISFDADPSVVQAQLNGLSSIGGVGGTVTVTGGVGDATGSNPYLVTFGGSQAGANQPLIVDDSSSLSGGDAAVLVGQVNPGDIGFEVCRPGVADVCKAAIGGSFGTNKFPGGSLSSAPYSLAVDQSTGAIYSIGDSRITKFTADGQFLRVFGYDVVKSGPGDSNNDETQRLTVKATGGTYTLTFEPPCCDPATTAPIPYNAPASGPGSVESALNAISSIGGRDGSVSVTGGLVDPGPPETYAYDITFGGVLGGDDVSQLNPSGTANLTGTGRSIAVTIPHSGGGIEVCTPVAECNRPTLNVPNGTGTVDSANGSLAVAPAGSPNAGNILLGERNARRVSEFTSDGDFVRAFGWDVVSSGPDDSSADEQQTITVGANTTGGKFSLLFNGVTTGATGNAVRKTGSNILEAVSTANGAFAVGQVVTGTGIPASPPTTITACTPACGASAASLTLSAASTSGGAGGTSTAITADDIDYNAPASQVETALNALPTIGGVGGSVSVSDGPGPATPYTITFGGTLGGDNVAQLSSSVAGLSVSSGSPTLTVTTPVPGGAFEICKEASGDACQSGTGGTALGQFDQIAGISEDSSGTIYTVEGPKPQQISTNRRVQTFTPQAGMPELLPASFGGPGAPDGTSDATSPLQIGIGPSSDVFVLKNFTAGADTCSDLSASPAEERIQILSSDGTTLKGTSIPCAGIPTSFGGINSVFQELEINPTTGVGYLTSDPSSSTPAQIYVLGEAGTAPQLVLNPPTNVGSGGVTISGTIDPNGPTSPGINLAPVPADTKYRVEYKRTSDASWTVYAPDVAFGHGTTPASFSVGISGLTPKVEYQARVVVTKPFGFQQVVETTAPFTTLAAPPFVSALSSSDVTATSSELHAQINPLGTDTSYHFEYGKTPAYGQRTPEIDIGDSLSPVSVQDHIDNLEPVVYHFRVVATNSEGTTASTDQTFNFYPEPCPNSTARQQTGSGSLPDCRAYELVTPGDAGTITLIPGGTAAPKASNPSRISILGLLGTLPGPWNPPNVLGDPYVATRTSTGWETSYVGIESDVAAGVGAEPFTGKLGAIGDETLSHNMQWLVGPAGFCCTPQLAGLQSYSPYVFDAKGKKLGRLPTNVADVPDALPHSGEGGWSVLQGWYGDQLPSPDFSHYFFSSVNVAFATGGLASGPGSVYDNDLATGAVTIASKLPGGGDIPAEPGVDNADRFLLVPEASEDGTHLLIAASAVCTPQIDSVDEACPLTRAHLYMRVNGATTYDVSIGHQVTYQGMTEDGSKVFFTSIEQLTGDDTDSSTDLYMWSEQSDSLTRVSAGAGSVGDTDACNSAWIAKCGVEVVPATGGGGPNKDFFGYSTDNSVAADNGDIYFYSPEQFVGSNGIPGKRNLYVARDGAIQYVATLDADKPATRIQVTPSGSFAAFITDSQLTSYDNAGFQAMYRYDAKADSLVCASCDPSGAAPNSDVEGSLNGIFISDDGRPFFSTDDAVVARDSNNAQDVYEYVQGRPQLVTTGIGTQDSGNVAPGALAFSSDPGFVGVSADGIDVYFTTRETLVSQDHNGGFPKFYDARTNGGFPVAAQVAPCQAADECHGADSSQPTSPVIGSTANLGTGGNVRHRDHKAHKRKKHHRRTKHKRNHSKQKHHKRRHKATHNRGIGK